MASCRKDGSKSKSGPSGTFGSGLIWEFREMPPEERERLNNLCRRIKKDEQNPKEFNGLLEELKKLLGGNAGTNANARRANPSLRLLQAWERVPPNDNPCGGMVAVRDLRSQRDAVGP